MSHSNPIIARNDLYIKACLWIPTHGIFRRCGRSNHSDEEGSGFRVREREMEAYRRLEDVVVYQKLCRLHMPESDRRWPQSSFQEDSKNDAASPTGFPEPWTPEP